MMRRVGLLLALLPLAVPAGSASYARQWPISLSQPHAGAFRIALTPEVYAAASKRHLRDVQVLDANGTPVASEVFLAPALTPPVSRVTPLRWFPLPATVGSREDVTRISVERDASGLVTTIRNRAVADAPATAATAAANRGWLIDRGADAGRLLALTVKWPDHATPIDAHFRLDASDDLRHWYLVDPDVHLMQLTNQGQQLRRESAQVDTRMRYLRLLPRETTSAFAPQAFEGTVRDQAEPVNWLWQTVHASGDASAGYRYHVQGRFPVERLDLQLPANSTVRWTVASADADGSDSSQPMHWITLAPDWNTWNLTTDQGVQHSGPLDLGTRITDRDWRLMSHAAASLAAPPVLRLGYRAGYVVFLAQGKAPYRLVAGQAAGNAPHAQLQSMLRDLRVRNGDTWQPAKAQLGKGSERDGAVAYQPAPPQRDWKNIVLWAVLILGSILVAGLAISLLRGKPQR